MKITLPVIDRRRKWIAAALWYAAFCALYTFTGRFHLRAPATFELRLPDRLIPFIDWTIWVYAWAHLLLYVSFFVVKGARPVSRLFYAISLASLLAFCIFLIYPTEFPRSVTMKEE